MLKQMQEELKKQAEAPKGDPENDEQKSSG